LRLFQRKPKAKSRPQPVFKNLTPKESSQVWWVLVRLLIFVGLLVLVSSVQLQFKFQKYSELTLTEGAISPETIIAEFEFQVPRPPEEIAKDQEAAKKRVIPVVRYNEDITHTQLTAMDHFFNDVKAIRQSEIDYDQKVRDVGGRQMNLSQVTIDMLLHSTTDAFLQQQVRETLNELFSAGIIADKRVLEPFPTNQVTLQRGDSETLVSINQFYDQNEALDYVVEIGRSLANSKKDTISVAFYEITSSFILPNLTFNAQKTQQRIAEAIESVPTIKETVLRDEKIIGKNERVDAATYQRLKAYISAKQTREQSEFWEIYVTRTGHVLFNSLLLLLFGFYLSQYRPRIYRDASKLVLLALLVATCTIIPSLSSPQANLIPFLIPVTVSAMLVTILFDAELGMLFTIFTGLLLGILPGINFSMVVMAMFSGVAASHSVRRVRHRFQFYQSFVLISGAYIISIFATDMIRFVAWQDMLQDLLWGIGNGMISTILAIGLLPVFESIFKITTDVTLLELGDFQRPLLRKLALEAPGTHSHSLVVSHLSEAAAEAIGANGLLCRVACYYHDIGKTTKPEYFVENQRGHNPHDSLSPSMSTLIIINHVKEGIEMARRAGIPQCIIDFIPEHHGTSLVSFFYNKALENDETVSEYDFRYPGPKPQTKETAIVMIADSVESAARVLKDPTPNRLEDLIHKIINTKFIQGQFDECDLTFKDLTKIGKAFLPILIAMYHSRIDYPEFKKTKASKDVDLYQSGAPADQPEKSPATARTSDGK